MGSGIFISGVLSPWPHFRALSHARSRPWLPPLQPGPSVLASAWVCSPVRLPQRPAEHFPFSLRLTKTKTLPYLSTDSKESLTPVGWVKVCWGRLEAAQISELTHKVSRELTRPIPSPLTCQHITILSCLGWHQLCHGEPGAGTSASGARTMLNCWKANNKHPHAALWKHLSCLAWQGMHGLMCPHQTELPTTCLLSCACPETPLQVPGQSGDMWSSQAAATSLRRTVAEPYLVLLMGKEAHRHSPCSSAEELLLQEKLLGMEKNLGNFLLCKDREWGSELRPVMKPPPWDHSSCAMSIWAPAQVNFSMSPALGEGAQHCSVPQPIGKPQAWSPWGWGMKAEKDKGAYKVHQCLQHSISSHFQQWHPCIQLLARGKLSL